MENQVRLFQKDTDDIEAIAEVLGKSLFSSPQWMYILPDAEKRNGLITQFMKFGMIYGLTHGETYVIGDPVFGVCVWFPPVLKFNLYDRLKESGVYELKEKAGHENFSRFVSSMEHMEWIKSKLTVPSYYYLMILGINPDMQRKGHGKKLMRPIMEKTNSRGLVCLLETSIYKTIPFYEKLGFQVIHDTKLINGPPVWILLKHPE